MFKVMRLVGTPSQRNRYGEGEMRCSAPCSQHVDGLLSRDGADVEKLIGARRSAEPPISSDPVLRTRQAGLKAIARLPPSVSLSNSAPSMPEATGSGLVVCRPCFS